jgi:hypothetical protein
VRSLTQPAPEREYEWALPVSNQIEFGLYPWIASNEKLKRMLAWTPRDWRSFARIAGRG